MTNLVTHAPMAYQRGGRSNEPLNLLLKLWDPVGSRHGRDAAAINLVVVVYTGVCPRAVHQQLALERWAAGTDVVDCQQRLYA